MNNMHTEKPDTSRCFLSWSVLSTTGISCFLRTNGLCGKHPCVPPGLTVSSLRITGSHNDQQVLPDKDTDRMTMMRAANETMRIIMLQTSTNTGKCK